MGGGLKAVADFFAFLCCLLTHTCTSLHHFSTYPLCTHREPEHHVTMQPPKNSNSEHVLKGARGELLPAGVPPLVKRWTPEDNFSQFTTKTLSSYY